MDVRLRFVKGSEVITTEHAIILIVADGGVRKRYTLGHTEAAELKKLQVVRTKRPRRA